MADKILDNLPESHPRKTLLQKAQESSVLVERIEWDDSFSVGIAEVDEQHKRLVEMTHVLYDLLKNNPQNYSARVKSVLEELTKYADYHFRCEENSYFLKYSYPSAEIHIMQHNNFISQVADQIERMPKSNVEDGKSLYNYLTKWLLNHIARADKAWSMYVLPRLSSAGTDTQSTADFF